MTALFVRGLRRVPSLQATVVCNAANMLMTVRCCCCCCCSDSGAVALMPTADWRRPVPPQCARHRTHLEYNNNMGCKNKNDTPHITDDGTPDAVYAACAGRARCCSFPGANRGALVTGGGVSNDGPLPHLSGSSYCAKELRLRRCQGAAACCTPLPHPSSPRARTADAHTPPNQIPSLRPICTCRRAEMGRIR